DERAPERDPGGEGLLDEPNPFDERKSPPVARFTALEIADGRLQITGDGAPRGCRARHPICDKAWDGRYVKLALTIAASASDGRAMTRRAGDAQRSARSGLARALRTSAARRGGRAADGATSRAARDARHAEPR